MRIAELSCCFQSPNFELSVYELTLPETVADLAAHGMKY